MTISLSHGGEWRQYLLRSYNVIISSVIIYFNNWFLTSAFFSVVELNNIIKFIYIDNCKMYSVRFVERYLSVQFEILHVQKLLLNIIIQI